MVWLLLIAAANLAWPPFVRAASGLSWASLIPLGIAGFLVLSAFFLYARERDPRLAAMARQLGTELRDIRHKIELVRSTRPHPHYSRDFQLPGQRFADFADELSTRPRYYDIVEAAYTAAHHVNEVLDMRKTRQGGSTAFLGVIPDDGLDAAYEAAGQALDALGERRDYPSGADG